MLYLDLEILHRDDWPTLYDVRIVAMTQQAFTLAGCERVDAPTTHKAGWCSQVSNDSGAARALRRGGAVPSSSWMFCPEIEHDDLFIPNLDRDRSLPPGGTSS
jgi:hypothetical protein